MFISLHSKKNSFRSAFLAPWVESGQYRSCLHKWFLELINGNILCVEQELKLSFHMHLILSFDLTRGLIIKLVEMLCDRCLATADYFCEYIMLPSLLSVRLFHIDILPMLSTVDSNNSLSCFLHSNVAYLLPLLPHLCGMLSTVTIILSTEL